MAARTKTTRSVQGLALMVLIMLPAAVRSSTALAQATATLTMVVEPTELAVGERARLRVQADISGTNGGDLVLPPLGAFEVVSRRVSRPMQFSFAFGQQLDVRSTIVHDLVLRAKTPGQIRLSPATLELGGQQFRSNEVRLHIQPGSNNGAAVPPGASADPHGTPTTDTPPALPPGETHNRGGFLRIVVDENEPYVGEQLVVSVYLYYPGNLPTAPQVLEDAKAEGCWVHNLLPQNRTLRSTVEHIGGVPFQVFLLNRFAAFPLRPGPLSISAPKVILPPRSLFSLFGGSGQRQELRGTPITVTAKSVPSTSSAQTVMVGTHSLSASVSPPKTQRGDPVTVEVVLTGDGNTRTAELATPEVDGIRFLQPEVEDKLETSSDALRGTRRWRWLAIPKRAGRFELPPFVLRSFDPETETLTPLTTEPLSFAVEGEGLRGGGTTQRDGVNAPPGTSRGESTPIIDDGALDLPAQRATSSFSRFPKPTSSKPWYGWTLATPPILFLFWVLALAARWGARRRGSEPLDRRIMKRLDALQREASVLERNDAQFFYRNCQQFFSRALEEILGQPLGALTRRELRERLAAHGAPEPVVSHIVEELEGFDAVRFSAEGSSREQALRCVARMQEQLDSLRASSSHSGSDSRTVFDSRFGSNSNSGSAEANP